MGFQTFKEFWFLGLGVGSRDMTFNIPDLKMTKVVHWAEELLHFDIVLSRVGWFCRTFAVFK